MTGATDNTPLLQVRDLRVKFPTARGEVETVRGVDLDIARGTTLGLVGESGCGKSLSMLSVMSLLPPAARASGSVRLLGEETIAMPRRRLRQLRGARVGMIFQDPMSSLNPVLTIGKQVEEALRIHHDRLGRRAAREQAIELLADVALPNPRRQADAFPFELSGGMRQRVMIAIAIANQPDLIIADEPTTALDVTIQAQILELLKRQVTDRGVGLILITHDLGVVAGNVERVAVMYAGRIVEDARVEDLFANPRHPYTKALLGCLPRLDRPGSVLKPIPGAPPSPSTYPRGCSFATRCPFVQPDCRTDDPQLRAVETSRVACHFAEDLELVADPKTVAHE